MNTNPILAAIDVTESLTLVLEQENQLLATSRASEISPLVPEKGRLGQQLRLAMDALRHNRALLETASRQERERLGRAGEKFHAALTENGRRLGALKKIAEGLVQSVAEEAMRQATPLKNYAQTGMMAARQSGPASLSLNQVI